MGEGGGRGGAAKDTRPRALRNKLAKPHVFSVADRALRCDWGSVIVLEYHLDGVESSPRPYPHALKLYPKLLWRISFHEKASPRGGTPPGPTHNQGAGHSGEGFEARSAGAYKAGAAEANSSLVARSSAIHTRFRFLHFIMPITDSAFRQFPVKNMDPIPEGREDPDWQRKTANPPSNHSSPAGGCGTEEYPS